MTTTAKRIEFEGVTVKAEYTEFGDRVVGEVRLPSGVRTTYEIARDGTGNFWSHGDHDFRTPEDREAADRLFPFEGKFRRPTGPLAAAAWAAVADAAPASDAILARRVAVPALADIAAACDAEGTPLAFPYAQPRRTCVECGSAVYGDFCTHCHEG